MPAARRCGSARLPSPAYSQAATWQKCSSSRAASPSAVWILLAEVAAARLFARSRRVEAQQLAELEEVGDAAGLLERLVQFAAVAQDT